MRTTFSLNSLGALHTILEHLGENNIQVFHLQLLIISHEWGNPGLAMSGQWSWICKWCSFCNTANHDNSTSHPSWWWHSPTLHGHMKVCHFILSYVTAFSCSQKSHLALFGLIHPLQPIKFSSIKYLLDHGTIFFLIVLFSQGQSREKLSSLPGKFKHLPSSKDMELAAIAIVNFFNVLWIITKSWQEH